MQRTDGLAGLTAAGTPEPSVVSIGVFDGVHLGHAAILEANLAKARQLGATPTVVTFRGHPKQLLLGRAPLTLTSLDHRLELFAAAGIAHTLVLDFTEDLRALDAEAFTRRVLIDGLGARAFVLGFDSKFGHDRRGTPDFLRERGHDVEVVEAVRQGGRAVSSTAIREAVTLGDLAGAGAMLGRPVTLMGRVVRGDQRGRTMGFPTANLDLDHELSPPCGVYACRARLLDRPGTPAVDAAVNVGLRPTVVGPDDGPVEPSVEAHLLDFDGDLYEQRLALEFVAFLRAEERFDGREALARAIAQDVVATRDALAGAESPPSPLDGAPPSGTIRAPQGPWNTGR